MKSRTSLLERRTRRTAYSPIPALSLPILDTAPMGPDCDGECPFCRGREMEQARGV